MSGDRPRPKSYEQGYVPPLAQTDLARILDLLNWLVTRATAMELVRAASRVADDPDLFARARERAADEVYAGVDPTLLPFGTVAAYVEWIARRLAGQVPEPPYPLRLGRPWGIPVHALHVALDDVDADAIRQTIRPGEIWVNATNLESKEWPLVGSWVQSQRRLLGQKFGHPGRKPRSGISARDEVAVRVAQESESKAAWAAVVKAGLREGRLYDSSNPQLYPRNKQFLARLRKRGRELLRS